jgi:glycosyltransferase involved in cell wall biosynthesis
VRICSPHCGVDPATTSGGETYERELLRHLGARGVQIDLMLARHKRTPPDVPNWTVHRLPIGRGLRWPVAAVLLPPLIRRLYEARPFDLLRAHSLRFIGPAALLARRRYRLSVPVVVHHHHLDAGWLNPLIEGPVMRAADRVVVGSEFGRAQAARELRVPAEKFAVVYYGVDRRFERRPRSAALVERFGLRDRPVVLFLGGLKRRKNPFLLLDVWRDVVREVPEARLVVAGTGPLLEPLRRRAGETLPPNAVVFTGYVPEAEKVDYFNLADVLLFPSALEGFGLSVAEAMACEVPVVVSARGSLPEVVAAGEGGFLCDPEAPATFVEKVLLLLAEPMLRRKFGHANRARVERMFRWEHCAAATERVYQDVLDDWHRRRPATR